MSADIPQADKPPLGDVGDAQPAPHSPPITTAKPLRMRTNTAEIDNTIIHPGSVKINVKGAFIVDQESGLPGDSVSGGSSDTKDIRLPNHTAVVSHIAVDVCFLLPSPLVSSPREVSVTDCNYRLEDLSPNSYISPASSIPENQVDD